MAGRTHDWQMPASEHEAEVRRLYAEIRGGDPADPKITLSQDGTSLEVQWGLGTPIRIPHQLLYDRETIKIKRRLELVKP